MIDFISQRLAAAKLEVTCNMQKRTLTLILFSLSASAYAHEDIKEQPYCIYADQKFSIGSEQKETSNDNSQSNTGWICYSCPTGPQWLSFSQTSVYKPTKNNCQ